MNLLSFVMQLVGINIQMIKDFKLMQKGENIKTFFQKKFKPYLKPKLQNIGKTFSLKQGFKMKK